MPYENIKKLFDKYLEKLIPILLENDPKIMQQKFERLSTALVRIIFSNPVYINEIQRIQREKTFQEVMDYVERRQEMIFGGYNINIRNFTGQFLKFMEGAARVYWDPVENRAYDLMMECVKSAIKKDPSLTNEEILNALTEDIDMIIAGSENLGDKVMQINPFGILSGNQREVQKFLESYHFLSETYNKYLKFIYWLISIEMGKRIAYRNVPRDFGERIKFIKSKMGGKYADLTIGCNNKWRNAIIGHNTYCETNC